jgi:hypothetical protein
VIQSFWLVNESGNEDVKQTVVVEIPDRKAHVSQRVAELVDRGSGHQAGVRKFSFAIVDVIEVWACIVRDINVLVPIIVKVRKYNRKASAGIFADNAGSLTDISESSVAIVMVEQPLFCLELLRGQAIGTPFILHGLFSLGAGRSSS